MGSELLRVEDRFASACFSDGVACVFANCPVSVFGRRNNHSCTSASDCIPLSCGTSMRSSCCTCADNCYRPTPVVWSSYGHKCAAHGNIAVLKLQTRQKEFSCWARCEHVRTITTLFVLSALYYVVTTVLASRTQIRRNLYVLSHI